MTLKNLKFADINGNTTINGIIFSSSQNGLFINIINNKVQCLKFFFNIGKFNYTNFQIYGQLSTKFILAIYVNILLNVDRNYIIPTKNEMIDENNTYYLIIPINLSHNCSLGQYYDSSKYSFC